jgi:hypothetical protein
VPFDLIEDKMRWPSREMQTKFKIGQRSSSSASVSARLLSRAI